MQDVTNVIQTTADGAVKLFAVPVEANTAQNTGIHTAGKINGLSGDGGKLVLELPAERIGQGGGGDASTIRALVDGTFSGAFVDDTITTIRNGAFWNCKGLTSVSCQNVTSVASDAFNG